MRIKQKITNRTLGADPEYAIIDLETGEAVSAVGLIGGTKEVPVSIGNGCSKQEDGVGVEFCIPPVTTHEEFLKYIQYCVNKGNEIVSKHNPNYRILAASSQTYAGQLDNEQAMTFGCSASYCAWTGAISERPNPLDVGDLRSFGCHLHIGFQGKLIILELENFIKLCDLYLGVPSILIDLDNDRRKIYGNAADFRFRTLSDDITHVIEYRTLGGNILGCSETILWALQNLDLAIEHFNTGKFDHIATDIRIQQAIDNSDSELARSLIEQYKIPMVDIQILNQNLVVNGNGIHAKA